MHKNRSPVPSYYIDYKLTLKNMADEKIEAEKAAHEARQHAADAEKRSASAAHDEAEAADRRAREAAREAGV